MRGRRPVGSGRGAGGLSRSPRTTRKIKDHRDGSGDWPHDPFPRHSRRSLSPPLQDRPRQSPGRRSRSIERRGYASRRSDRGKRLQREQPSPAHPRSRPSSFGDDGYELPPKYILPDHASNLDPGLDPGLQLSRVGKDKDLLQQGNRALASGSSGLDMQSTLLQKSVFLNDGSSRTFYSLPPEASYSLDAAAALKSDNMGSRSGVRISDSEVLPYHNRLNDPYDVRERAKVYLRDPYDDREREKVYLRDPYDDREREKVYLRDPYDDREREKVYSGDAPFPVNLPPQLRPLSGASSSGLAKDDFLGFYHDRLQQSTDRHVRGAMSKFSDDPLDRIGYSQAQLADPVRRSPLGSQARDEFQAYGYHELSHRERDDHGFLASDDYYRNNELSWRERGDNRFLASDEFRRKTSWVPPGSHRDTFGSSFMDLAGHGVDDASRKYTSASNNWDQHHFLHGDDTMAYHEMKGIHEDFVGGTGSGHLGCGLKPSRAHELTSMEERYASVRDPAPLGYRERPRSPMLSDRHLDVYARGASPLLEESFMADYYGLPSERMVGRKYVMDNAADELERRSFYNDRAAVRRKQSPSGDEEIWPGEEVLPSKSLALDRNHYQMTAHKVSRSNAWMHPGTSSAHAKGGRGMSLKRRLRPGPSGFHGSFSFERGQQDVRPHKFWKRDIEDRHSGLNTHDRDVADDNALVPKTDPPEDSEEFKHLVNKAFLQFSKRLNESSHQQSRYRDQGKGNTLLCFACDSLSKEFPDMHSLVNHTYHSLKVGLRTAHLGLHKALCVLMGWDWRVAPDNARFYQSIPDVEAKALKEDLILWPPLVIIHNSSIGNKVKRNGPKVMNDERMEEILRGMGFGAGKTRVCRGKPADQSVFIVKFMPTFSGYQEAERLHKHFVDQHRGRQEFQQITASKDSGKSIGEAHDEKVEERLLYGYMAIIEDLYRLDPETNRRCVVKSKKDIEAIADAPLSTD